MKAGICIFILGTVVLGLEVSGLALLNPLDLAYTGWGKVECKGFDHIVGLPVFQHIFNDSNADFGGDYLCKPTCGGDCIPYNKMSVAPISGYAFGCKCSRNRCSRNGPIITQLAQPHLKVTCRRDARCTCAGMDWDIPQNGYLCNWFNINKDAFDKSKPLAYSPDSTPSMDENLSIIRWCSCCPK